MGESLLGKVVIYYEKNTADGILYRVIEIGTTILLIKMNCDRFSFLRYDREIFSSLLTEKKFLVTKDDSSCVVNPEQISDLYLQRTEIERFLELLNRIEDLEKHNSKGTAYKELCERLNISYATAVRKVRKYLQNGRTEAALLDKRSINKKKEYQRKINGKSFKNGEVSNVIYDEILKRNFKEAFKELMDSVKSGLTIADAYDNMIMRRYTTVTINDAGELTLQEAGKLDRPTYKQFYYFCRKELDGIPFRKIKNGLDAYRNNSRVLKGNAQYRVYYSGQLVEIDETEDEIKLVASYDRSQVIGRAVIYIAIDAFSGAIVGASVHLKNNSYSGVAEVLMSMLEPHRLQTERYGISCSETEFPSEFIPQEYRLDHGAEYESEAFANVCKELQIDQHLVPVAGGSWKGTVERTHAQFRNLIRSQVVKHGLILKDTNNKKAEKTACLTIEDLRSIVYKIIIYLNTSPKTQERNLDQKMLKDLEEYTPQKKWESGLQAGKTRLVTDTNRTACFWGILRHDKNRKFRLTREGIKYRDLRYVLNEKWFIKLVVGLTRNSIPIDVRYDPRSIDKVYYKYKEQIYEIPLAADKRENLQTFLGLEWDAYDTLYQMKLDQLRNSNTKAGTKRRMLKAQIGKIVQDAVENHPQRENKTENQKGACFIEKVATSVSDAKYREMMPIVTEIKKPITNNDSDAQKQIKTSPSGADEFDVDDYFDI